MSTHRDTGKNKYTMNANILPVEIWHLIFSFTCTDDGSTGRSLSLVLTHFQEISALFKYQSIDITHWSQIIAFSRLLYKLPASQTKTVFLFVHHPYPFLDVNWPTDRSSEKSQSEDDHKSSEESRDIREIRNESAQCNDGDCVLDVESLSAGTVDHIGQVYAGDRTSDSDSSSGSDDSWHWHYSDGVSDSEFEGSCDDEEEREILEDVEYLEAVRDGRLRYSTGR